MLLSFLWVQDNRETWWWSDAYPFLLLAKKLKDPITLKNSRRRVREVMGLMVVCDTDKQDKASLRAAARTTIAADRNAYWSARADWELQLQSWDKQRRGCQALVKSFAHHSRAVSFSKAEPCIICSFPSRSRVVGRRRPPTPTRWAVAVWNDDADVGCFTRPTTAYTWSQGIICRNSRRRQPALTCFPLSLLMPLIFFQIYNVN